MNNIAACVVTYNRKDKLKKCLDSLLNQTYKDLSIVVVDNCSTDNTKEFVSEYVENNMCAERLVYYRTDKNLGGAGGFNYAIKKVVEYVDYIWIMDDDTYPKPEALEYLVSAVEYVDNEFGFLCSVVEWKDGSACVMNYPKLESNIYNNLKAFEKGLIPVQTASFVSVFIKSEKVLKVGLPIKDYFIWGDDLEYTSRLRPYGGYLVIQSVVIHDMAQNEGSDIKTLDISRADRYYMAVRNRIFTTKKYGTKKEIIKAYLSPIKTCISILLKSKDHKLKRIRITLKGLAQGIRFNPEIEMYTPE